jgi:hypothetical protein
MNKDFVPLGYTYGYKQMTYLLWDPGFSDPNTFPKGAMVCFGVFGEVRSRQAGPNLLLPVANGYGELV